MANTPFTGARVDPAVLDAVREVHDLADAPDPVVIRFALALAARLDPARLARVHIGRPPVRQET